MISRRQVIFAGSLVFPGMAGCSGVLPEIGSSDDGEANILMAVSNEGTEVVLLTYSHTTSVGEVTRTDRTGAYHIVVELSEAGVERFENGLEAIGAFQNPEEHTLRIYYDGEIVYRAILSQGLADAVRGGDFDGENLELLANNRSTAVAMKKELDRLSKTHTRTA